MRRIEWHAANGDVLYFGTSLPFLMDTFYPGTASASAEVTRAIGTDGQNTHAVVRDPITPSLTGNIIASGASYEESQKNLDTLRRKLQAAIDPKHFGTLIYHNYSGSYRLRCRPIAGPTLGKRFGNTYPMDIEWMSDAPYWVWNKRNEITIGILGKRWVFPWAISPTIFGIIYNDSKMQNPTNIDIYPSITLSNTKSDKITLGNRTTGDYVTIEHSIAMGESLVIDMSLPGITLIHADGQCSDVTHWHSLDSTFPWCIIPGENEIYSAVDTTNLTPEIHIAWDTPEVGV